MNRTLREPAPALLEQHGAQIGIAYAQRRRTEPSYRYQWPHRNGQRLYDVAHAALRAMTDERCSYCDGHPIDSVGEDQIDHFCPKSLPQFYELVCTWTNLFLTCVACNKAKLDAWHELLLRPDAADYSFERYFEYRFDTGELHPNTAASPFDQSRAAKTIEICDLNRAGACTQRRRTVRLIRSATSEHERADIPYRFLLPMCLV
jgi:uncharacterized protein (TIGR02646 family)